MQFKDTKTYTNLARSFAGESQAGMRYQLIAKLATAEGYAVLADTIRTIAKNETYHAKTFFNTLLQKAGSCENIDLNAGYPFHFGTLEENLAFAAKDERAEFEEVYPAFAEDAEKEAAPKTTRKRATKATVEIVEVPAEAASDAAAEAEAPAAQDAAEPKDEAAETTKTPRKRKVAAKSEAKE